ncbi:MAG: hypothetical protein LIO53_01050 [Oscillospiraceae bacterium]|nr:hypothetical protein [Oscillospiraceae bacterium]
MKKKTIFLIGAAAAAGVYGAVAGKGPFNKMRFKEQHERISHYVETHYPNALYTPIEATEKGWVTVIKRFSQPKIILYVTRDDFGNYIFTESSVS